MYVCSLCCLAEGVRGNQNATGDLNAVLRRTLTGGEC